MWVYLLRRLLYYIPLYLTILLVIMLLLRVNADGAVAIQAGKNPDAAQLAQIEESLGLDRPIYEQYWRFIVDTFTLRFEERSWDQSRPVGEMLAKAIPPTLMITVPSLVITASVSVLIGLVSSFNRGRWPDRLLMIAAVIGMSISYLVYIIIGQYFGAYVLGQQMQITPFEIQGYEPVVGLIEGGESAFDLWAWVRYCSLPVLIGVVVAMGYDTRFYRSVMVEESGKDYITTARAKGVSDNKIMLVHMLKNAMIPIVTRISVTLPFLITGSILVEVYFNIPGMGRTLINAIRASDFPVVQATVALLAAAVIVTVLLTDVVYALV
ncbi:MAG: ABC transporter permease, partial [Planctomycetota bacterium]